MVIHGTANQRRNPYVLSKRKPSHTPSCKTRATSLVSTVIQGWSHIWPSLIRFGLFISRRSLSDGRRRNGGLGEDGQHKRERLHGTQATGRVNREATGRDLEAAGKGLQATGKGFTGNRGSLQAIRTGRRGFRDLQAQEATRRDLRVSERGLQAEVSIQVLFSSINQDNHKKKPGHLLPKVPVEVNGLVG
ncbi:hypothetical protein BC937DRAFT_87540 [Endogone sp. FLAS-F59071]|nr:hypothetical protein BC937DRAFT_87540 [Endogone sp. FLAS-F59071]|eukprot:RUS22729.1 hypothetical protein BC937DRAFT_87540 [Endogone sp. FLAS-F59071]